MNAVNLPKVIFMIDFERVHHIFLILSLKNRNVTSDELAQTLKVTTRTIKNDMKSVALFAANNGAEIIAKRGEGYQLHVVDEKRYAKIVYQLKIRASYSTSFSVFTPFNYLTNMAQYMISNNDFFKLDEVTERFLIPKHTVHQELRNFRNFLSSYHLKMISKPNFGSQIVGSEFNRRIAMLMLFDILFHKAEIEESVVEFYQYFETDFSELNIFRQILLSTLRNSGFRVFDDYTQCLTRYLILQQKRVLGGFCLTLSNRQLELLEKFPYICQIAQKIVDEIARHYHQQLTEHEVKSVALLLLIWQDIDGYHDVNYSLNPLYNQLISLTTVIEAKISTEVCSEFATLVAQSNVMKSVVMSLIYRYESNSSIFDIRGSTFIDIHKKAPLAILISKYIIDVFTETYQTSISPYLVQHVINKLSIWVGSLPYPTKKINILISSSDGIDGANYIAMQLKQIFNPELFDKITALELYEGRTIPEADYDIYLLNNIPNFSYAYYWPYIEVSRRLIDAQVRQLYSEFLNYRFDFSYFYQEVSSEFKIKKVSYRDTLSSLLVKYQVDYQSILTDYIFESALWLHANSLPKNTIMVYILNKNEIFSATVVNYVIVYNLDLSAETNVKIFNDILSYLVLPDKTSLPTSFIHNINLDSIISK